MGLFGYAQNGRGRNKKNYYSKFTLSKNVNKKNFYTDGTY